ncbi:DNA helicase-2/ATP-dependent DNA helicase PcrA [Saccharopolyspora spinosa]|uniref:DNA 3'-5' helicase n=1 Tax=Saccharopolyspora spinosa TaxID=60894 RepID=A0A2N3Y6Y2_SACSN|nr:DNA helicase-2/ATP-dependent DNA helicase PcrA [Saccharopolyspora spinosa]
MFTLTEQALTGEQARAAGSTASRTYIEAAPGSGKTTVAAERFGMLRFAPDRDDRAVVAVSFTRSATAELRQRIRLRWGPSALVWPHRVVTLDTILCDMLSHLLRRRLLRWPGGQQELVVHDTWKVRLKHNWKRQQPYLTLNGDEVSVSIAWPRRPENRVDLESFREAIKDGECTHDDVRTILAAALNQSAIARVVAQRLRETVRAVIVDEVFDANSLDLLLVKIACDQGIGTTIIGDPWQALYRFRGARPEQVPALVDEHEFSYNPLTKSFRFRTHAANVLSTELRSGHPVVLPKAESAHADVVLSGKWNDLWDCGENVLPLSFGSTPESPPESAAVLLLDQVTQTTVGHHAVFLQDALTNLGITDPEALRRMAQPFTRILEILRSDTSEAADTAWKQLSAVIKQESPREFPRKHPVQVARLKKIRQVLRSKERRFIPGLTIHQAKGREWGTVAVGITDREQTMLATGLDVRNEEHRKLYVALTRGRDRTIAI